MYDLPLVCQSCPYWELAKPPYVCIQCERTYVKINNTTKKMKNATDKWIPCFEKMPDECTQVFATCVGTNGNYVAILVLLERIRGLWVDGDGEFLRSGEVIAWMPIKWPEPYRNENNG